MAASNGSSPRRSGSSNRRNPQTRGQRLKRVAYLTRKIEEGQAAAEERLVVMRDLREKDEASYAEIAEAAGKTPQAIHKALTKSGA